MYCPACGARNSHEARFCNQCGVRIATMAPVDGPGVTPPATAVASQPPVIDPGAQASQAAPADGEKGAADGTLGGPTIQTRLPTMGGTGQSIALPMTGPSRRTMIIAGIAIALAGTALGAGVAMRALNRRQQLPPPPPPENNVALVETPHVLGQQDASVETDASQPNAGTGETRAARGRPRTGTATSGAQASTTSPGTTATTGVANTAGEPGPNAGNGGTTVASAGSTTRPTSGGTARTGSSGTGTGTGTGTASGSGTGSGTGSGGTGSGNGATPSAGDLAQMNNSSQTTGSGISPRGPSVGGYVQGEETDATGTMDPTVFSFVYRHYRSQISACQSMVTRNAQVAGTMRVRVRLGLDGHVVRTRVLSNTTNNADLATCVQNSIRSWAYPQPEGGEVEFDYNFGFGS